MRNERDNLPPILPVGTAVVTRAEVRSKTGEVVRPRGAVGVIISSPKDLDHLYRVRFTGGEEASLHRLEMYALKHFQQRTGETDGVSVTGTHDPADPMAEYDLYQHVVYRVIVGSRAYGLERDGSDVDRRGVYLPPADLHWSLFGLPEQLENPDTEECYWELGKFLMLALKANPNVLEVLYSPIVEHATDLAQELVAIRGVFLSKLVYQTYNGYVLSQFKKLESDLRQKGEIKPKHAMHLVRLLLSGITILREGHVPVTVGTHRDALLAIRDGRMTWDEVNAWRMELHKDFDRSFAATTLPDRPDYARINEFLIKARRSMVR